MHLCTPGKGPKQGQSTQSRGESSFSFSAREGVNKDLCPVGKSFIVLEKGERDGLLNSEGEQRPLWSPEWIQNPVFRQKKKDATDWYRETTHVGVGKVAHRI